MFIIGLSSDWKIIEFNPEAEKLLGLKRELVIGNNYVICSIPPLMRKKVLQNAELLSGSLPNRYKNVVKALDGDWNSLLRWSAHKLVRW